MAWQVVLFSIFLLCKSVPSQVHYFILEEINQGSVVGNIANDLGLDIKELAIRKLQIASQNKKHFLKINVENGDLILTDRVDREAICGTTDTCLLNLEILAENPVNVFLVTIEIQDVNDHAPYFSRDTFDIGISESATPGTHFALGHARDPDTGKNSLQSYNLTLNEHFSLGEKVNTEGINYPELVLKKSLDREKQKNYELTLTACDGGKPMKTGTALIKIVVQDVSDNFPAFGRDIYRISLDENTPKGYLVLHLNAIDEDEGTNAQITYSFSHFSESVLDVFDLDPQSGDIKTCAFLDYEVIQNYEITVEAKDGGGLVTHCSIYVNVIDVNDNAPEIIIKTLISPIMEDMLPGTQVALINVNDMDSGNNGEVICQITGILPFKLMSSSSNYYKLITTGPLDREIKSDFNITIIAEDKGSPPLINKKTIQLIVSDVNDNPPVFDCSVYTAYVLEHNMPGSAIHHVHASDLDIGENAHISYVLLNTNIDNIPISSYVSVNLGTGMIYAQRIFDYEELREFQFQIMAKDNGLPALCSNVTVKICINDENDNEPKILYPSPDIDGATLFEFIPSFSEKGYLVTKVIAVDEDSGHSAWLSYHLQQAPDSSYLVIGEHNGEIRLTRDLQGSGLLRHTVVIIVRDNGVPCHSATASLNLIVADNFQQILPEIRNQPREQDTSSHVTLYLVISIAFICLVFILTVIITVIAKRRKQNASTAFGSLNSTWYPQLSLKYPSEFSDGSLPLPFSYDVCVTLDSRQNKVAYLKPIQNVPTDNLVDTSDSETGNNSAKDCEPPCNSAQVRHIFWYH